MEGLFISIHLVPIFTKINQVLKFIFDSMVIPETLQRNTFCSPKPCRSLTHDFQDTVISTAFSDFMYLPFCLACLMFPCYQNFFHCYHPPLHCFSSTAVIFVPVSQSFLSATFPHFIPLVIPDTLIFVTSLGMLLLL